jgi:hypothetical protein
MLTIIADAMGIATHTDKRQTGANYYSKKNMHHLKQERQNFSQAQRALDIARVSGHW